MTEPTDPDTAPDEFESVEGGDPDGNPEPQAWVVDDDDDTDITDDPDTEGEEEDTVELSEADLAEIDKIEQEE